MNETPTPAANDTPSEEWHSDVPRAAATSPGATTTSATAASAVTVAAQAADADTETLARVAAAVQPSVVSIAVTTREGSGEGSGVVLRADGLGFAIPVSDVVSVAEALMAGDLPASSDVNA